MPLEKLNILDFLNNSLVKGKQFINIPIFLVDQKEKFVLQKKEFEKYKEIDAQALYKEFLECKYMFVIFSDCGVNYQEVACIDGNEYIILEEMEVEEYSEDDEILEGFVFTENTSKSNGVDFYEYIKNLLWIYLITAKHQTLKF